ncbi:endothelial zinc finger protein induced by tumor necrosis factor alpha-like [Xiphophorus maculatus]|uniref:endothelial zinc finger protein induced by tumor necrosis factor alpha-like n=1 Tax=Xiphophorus maculatus TaxID=8083 RepID=UPI000C6E938B|nr:endothelial zinc finger protein induced by tumor necrosis factor alpha-like [Xiphophorus maculatus]XP_023182433.1 endothelial zinc finger protein induced by tumor necrosis factor alpha-like [Xiphophorus maculatus]
MEPPGGGQELCILLLRQGGRREVGCQWESPEEEEETRKEVGCQSCRAETREAAVQVDLLGQNQNLLGQNLSWRHSGSSADLLQCLTVRPDGSDGGALLRHCVPNRTRTRIIRPAAKLSDEPTDTRTRKRPVPQSARRNGRPGRLQRRSPDPQEDEQEEEEGGPEDEDTGDPTWTPRGDRPLAPSEPEPDSAPDSGPDLQQVKLEPDSTVCDVCGKVMKNKSSLARHSFIHTGKKPFACHLCPLRFNRRDNLRHHLGRLHPDGAARRQRQSTAPAWLCAVCGKTFVCRSRLKTHEAIHSGVKPFRCDLCPKAYMRSNDLQHHTNVAHSSGAAPPLRPASLLCHLCGKEFKCRSQLAVHFQTHTGERPHLCDICGRKFARQYQLKRHKVLLHPSRSTAEPSPPPDAVPDPAFSCGVCGRRLKSEMQLTEHARIHVGDNLHRCSVCLRGFQRPGYLRQHHLRVHLRAAAGDAPGGSRRRGASPSSFPCTACGKTFRFRSLLASHALVHGDVRPFACDFCSRSFRRLSHLKRHRRAVHADGARPPQSFVCHICGKDKKCRSQLARHVVIHTGERPFACDLCPARFNRRGNLQQHQRRMHGVGKAGEAPPILFQDEDDAPSYKQEELLDRVGGAGDEDEQLDAT